MPAELASLSAAVSVALYTEPELIVPELRESDPAGIIEELSHRFAPADCRGCIVVL